VIASSAKKIAVRAVLPDLVASEIGLDERCYADLAVRNAGQGVIPDETFDKGQIRVLADGGQKAILLVKADPKRALKAPCGAVSVDSGIALEKEAWVQVVMDSSDQVDEGVEGETNNSRRERLTPKCVADKGKQIGGEGRELTIVLAPGGAGGKVNAGLSARSAGAGSRFAGNSCGCTVPRPTPASAEVGIG
jgi:hypothetical protein